VVAAPTYEAPEWSDPQTVQPGVLQVMEIFLWAFAPFRSSSAETYGQLILGFSESPG